MWYFIDRSEQIVNHLCIQDYFLNRVLQKNNDYFRGDKLPEGDLPVYYQDGPHDQQTANDGNFEENNKRELRA